LLVPEGGEVMPSLTKMHEIWVELTKPSQKTKSDNKLYIERFISMFGNLRVDQITRKKCREFRDCLKKLPAATPAHVSKKSFSEIISWTEKGDPPRLPLILLTRKAQVIFRH
jgi:hypothetical protein